MNDEKNTSLARVIKVIDDFTLVINKGFEHGVKAGDNFLVYYIEPEELIDPLTGESLGKLEIVRGSGSAIHVQQKLTTIRTNRTESGGRIIRKSSSSIWLSITGETIEERPEKQPVPFEQPEVGDFAKPV